MIAEASPVRNPEALQPSRRTAVLLLGGQDLPGKLLIQMIGRHFAGVFPQILFHDVAVIDYDVLDTRLVNYDIGREIERLKEERRNVLDDYAALARRMGMAADCRLSAGIDPVRESAAFCAGIAGDHPLATFFLGKLVYARERWYHWLLRDHAAGALQAQLEKQGIPFVVLPVLATGA
jgi:hypothetical protein